MKNYTDIINLPHYISRKHPQMNREARAAQFAPFAALTGFGEAVVETARLTNTEIDLPEEMKIIINGKLNFINTNIKHKPLATFTYFLPDKYKEGGEYTTLTGNVRQIDLANNKIILTNNKKINITDIIGIKL